MKKWLIPVLLLVWVSGWAQQEVHRKGRIFGYWGYNRAAYTKSTFNICGDGYSLKFKGVKSYDKPTKFSYEDYIQFENISKPQYNYRIGYYLTDNWSISFGMDHMKYFMIPDQNLEIDGFVTQQAGGDKYAGNYNGEEVNVPWRFLWFHHSDGLNYASLEIEYNKALWVAPSKKFYADVLANAGFGMVVPKTYVMILNEDVDNKFHIAGFGPSVKVGGRFTFFTNFFVESAFKTGYVWMPNILVNDAGTAAANQHFGWLQWFTAVGFSIPLSKQGE